MAANDLIAFAERVLALLEQGSFVATYKYAVLLALMDLCLEGKHRRHGAPDSVTTTQLAEKVIELYWPQTLEFNGATLRQNSGKQARIVADICNFRDGLEDRTMPIHWAKGAGEYERLLRSVERTLILMPLPRVQIVNGDLDRLLYEISWDRGIERQRHVVDRYLRTHSGFDNNIRLLPGVGDHLVVLNGLLRPLIHRAWSGMVAQLNDLHESRLERFLFGVDRTALSCVRPELLEMQRGECFYCRGRVGAGEVDHFLPWARYPDDGIHNLVVADEKCNAAKRDFLAATEHVAKWRERNDSRRADLDDMATRWGCQAHLPDTYGVARSLYARLPCGSRLWLRKREFVTADVQELRSLLHAP